MEKKVSFLGLVTVLVCVCSSGVLAASMGPPVAGLEAGKWGMGVDYAYSDMTVDTKGTQVETANKTSFPPIFQQTTSSFEGRNEDIETNMVFANLGYGVLDNLEVFLRLGASAVDIDVENVDWDGSGGFAYGVGAKATFCEFVNLKLGALAQMTWVSGDAEVTVVRTEIAGVPLIGPRDFTGDGEFEWDEIKIAIGPSFELTEGISIYGGSFYHLINGDFDVDLTMIALDGTGHLEQSGDFDEKSDFGFFGGGQIDITERLPFYAEWQSAGDADVVGASIVYRF
ncbi:MAG: hypothetical protein ACYSWO_15125 [Planctomycetota bacterium]|jgi:hypothetical protein